MLACWIGVRGVDEADGRGAWLPEPKRELKWPIWIDPLLALAAVALVSPIANKYGPDIVLQTIIYM
jgi:hypothetical protein